MKKNLCSLLFFAFSIVILSNCKSKVPAKTALENVSSSQISKIALDCNNQLFDLNQNDQDELFQILSEAQGVGMFKGIVHNNIYLCTQNNDTLKLRALDNKFKTPQHGDYTFKMMVAEDYLDKLCISYQNGVSMSSIAQIKMIFDEYIKYDESTDSEENKKALSRALKNTENQSLTLYDLELIINVWMYYTVTDFDTVTLTKNALLAHQEKSIEAVKKRMNNPKEWESIDSAPFSELESLLEFLKRGY